MNATIDGEEVNIEEAPAFSFSLYDHIELGRVRGDNSTNIDVVLTNAARRVLGSSSMQEVPAQRSHVLRIGEEGATYWKGDVRVESWADLVARCSSVGGNGSWIDKVKQMRLREIPMGESLTITSDQMAQTWEDEDDPLYFPLINYGSFSDRNSAYVVTATKLRPAIRLMHFLKRAFQEVGYSLNAQGRFATLFPKLVCPQTSDNVGASQTVKDENFTSFYLATTKVFASPPTNAPAFPLTDTIDVDLAGNGSGGDIFTAPFDMTVQVRISGDLLTVGPTLVPYQVYWYLRDVATTARVGPVSWFSVLNGTVTFFDGNDAIIQADLVNGQQVELVWVPTLPITSASFDKIKVSYTVTDTPFVEDIRINIADAAPDMSVAEALKSIVGIDNLAVVTNDMTGSVDLWFFDDFLLPIEQGVDWRGRENQETKARKIEPAIPQSYGFRYAEDDGDSDLLFWNGYLAYPGYGNGDYNLSNGYDKPKEVEVDFAATAMAETFGTCFIPVMRKDSGTYQVDYYDREPRILISDGLAPGEWNYNGLARTEYPRCYFVAPGERYSLAFGDDNTFGQAATGTIGSYYNSRLQGINDRFVLEIELRLMDDELIALDFRAPVMVSDGYADGWYYILTVSQKRFGVDEYTKVQLVQA